MSGTAPIRLLPQQMKILRHAASEPLVSEETIRIHFRVPPSEGAAIVRILQSLDRLGFLDRDVYGNYAVTDAGRRRLAQRNPPRERRQANG